MKRYAIALLTISLLTTLSPNSAFAAKGLKVKVSGGGVDKLLIQTYAGGTSDKITVASLSNGAATVTAPSTKISISLIVDSQSAGSAVFAYKVGKKYYSLKDAKKKKLCAQAKAITAIDTSKLTGVLALKYADGFAAPSKALPIKALISKAVATVDSQCIPDGAGNLGVTSTNSESLKVRSNPHISADDADGDGIADNSDQDDDNDGALDIVDADNDGDSILDNDDQTDNDTTSAADGETSAPSSFRLFSSFDGQLENVLNVSLGNVTKENIDTALQSRGRLSIPRAGLLNQFETIELDCGDAETGLKYCRSGGTGQRNEIGGGIVGSFPDEDDSDGDGLGEFPSDTTASLQLNHGATSDEIKGGDVLFQVGTDSNATTKYFAGMINYIFLTNPAIQSLQIGDTEYNITYPVSSGDPGTSANPFMAPASGDVVLTFEVSRPQRRGIEGTEEDEWMDLGNLRYLVYSPTGVCNSGGGSCSGNFGWCPASSYSTTDSNLEVADDDASSPDGKGSGDTGVQDNLGDLPQDSANTLTFSVNLTACLAARSVSWSTGQSIALILLARNAYNDNATVLFNVKRQ